MTKIPNNIGKMPAFWNAIRGQRWRAAHDLMNEIGGIQFAQILQWRPRNGKI